ncbi:DUF4238 domain-containing protein [Rugosimonospora africana]|uniref:DUF4238 domain-containing protein n=1 Tax=Rugosimonospora africana TaxID=556532 RepID=A0A8J3VS73_9ACTN|nr:DUF4238 domain-containing protein [Rugosimonospora africana]GIH16153.1 hypothetical protein Raf01_43250 [Rugosimonospora africana]
MGQDKARRHHQVPQFYLRGFSDGGDRVKVVRFGDRPSTFIASVKNVAVEANFYAVDWLDPAREGLAEQLIGDIERTASEALRLLVRGQELSVEQRGAVATWVVLQYVRGRGKRADSIGLQKTMLRANLAVRGKQRLASQLGLSDIARIDEIWDRVVVRGELPDPPTARYNHIRMMLKTVSRVAPAYALAHWQLVTFQRRRLFTSDQPVCLWSRPSDDPGIGLLTADAVSVPLTRNIGLVIFPQIPSNTIGESAPTTQYHRWFTTQAWMCAEEFLIMHPDDEVPDRLPSQREPQLGTLGLPAVQQFIEIGEAWHARRDHAWAAEADTSS